MIDYLLSFLVVGLFSVGLIIGFLIGGRNALRKFFEKATVGAIYLLLFVLGQRVGGNDRIISELDKVGVVAFVIAAASIAGSILMVYVVNMCFLNIGVDSGINKKKVSLRKGLISSLIIFVFFAVGVVIALLGATIPLVWLGSLTDIALYCLMLLVGVTIGGDTSVWHVLKQTKLALFLLPFSIVAGTLLGATLVGICLSSVSWVDSLAVGCGMGYYSLSAVILSNIRGEMIGIIALLANLFREILTLLLTPLLVRYFGPLAGVASGGATSMDTSLPVIVSVSGREVAIPAFFSGLVLTVLVPVLISFLFLVFV
jgi:uncharacterized membrane protein YbjE (DUF340 family)